METLVLFSLKVMVMASDHESVWLQSWGTCRPCLWKWETGSGSPRCRWMTQRAIAPSSYSQESARAREWDAVGMRARSVTVPTAGLDRCVWVSLVSKRGADVSQVVASYEKTSMKKEIE